MQRSKAAVSVEVRQVIGTLCRLLAAAGLDGVPAPETFRRAKFGGGPEVESQFWQLLASILHATGTVCSGGSTQPTGASEHRKLVAAGLWQTGYHADWMYWREEEGNEGRCFSSKDLLLALGWLLAVGALEKLMSQRVRQLDKTLLTSIPESTQVPRELQFDAASLRRLQWLIGCLRHHGRILLSMLEERTRLLHAVLSPSCLSSASPLSDQSSTVLKDDCVHMQQLCDLLEAYVNWKQVEEVFWTWMGSVVDCHLSDPVVKRPVHTAGVSAHCRHGRQELEKLDNMLLQLPAAQKRQTGRRDDEDRGRGRFQNGLDASSFPLLFCPPSRPSFSQAYRARLQAERPVRHNSCPAEELRPSQAAQLLLQTEARLLERRDQQRLANKMLLQEMIGKQDEMVLIPP